MIRHDDGMSYARAISTYADAAMRAARFDWTDDDATCYGEIPALAGVYAIGTTREECEQELREVLEDWIVLGISLHHDLPGIDGVSLPTPSRA